MFSLPALLEMSSKSVSTISELKIACDEAHNKKYKKGRFLGKVRLNHAASDKCCLGMRLLVYMSDSQVPIQLFVATASIRVD